jgi:outer membrane protein assembly factor BamB
MRFLIALALASALAFGVAFGFWLHDYATIDEVRGSPTEEFVTTQQKTPEQKRPRKVVLRLPWPTYGLKVQRTHTATDFKLRPPFRLRWTFKAHHVLEFPPSVAYGRLYVAQQRGRFFAFHHRTGKLVWQRRFNHCSASSPTVAYRVVYHAWMQPLPCNRFPRSQPGMITAMAARTGKIIWRFRAGAFETSPLVIGRTLYAGSWDRKLYAIDIYTGKPRWTFTADHEINSSPAYSGGKIYFGTDGGSVYAIDARTGRFRWRAQALARFGRREYFYATPTIAYGRVFIGNADGTLYAFGASSGRLLWAQQAGTYIYTAAAVWRRKVYVGTWDGKVSAFSASTGDTIWSINAVGAVHGAPTILNGVLYYSTCPICGKGGVRHTKRGPPGTFGVDARNGRRLWKHWAGRYSPVVADRERMYVVGYTRIYGLEPIPRHAKKKPKQQKPKRP